MKKFLLFTLMALPLAVQAQNEEVAPVPATVVAAASAPTFGYLSYSTMLQAMPDYALAHKQYAELEEKYATETKRVEEEFNAKYEEFLDAQRDLVPSILRKRQTEIQEMMEKNVAFKQEAQRLLKQAETDALAPVKLKLNEAVAKVGAQQGYAFILNTDGDACPYINPEMGEDATEAIRAELNK